jgi:hypothetical protein
MPMFELPALAAYFALVLSASLALGALILASQLWVSRSQPESRMGLGLLGQMDAPDFTRLVAQAWAGRGHRVTPPPAAAVASRLQLESEGQRWLVDCRHRRDEHIQSEHIQALMRAVTRESAAGGILVSAGYCDDGLKRSARGPHLRLIEGAGLWGLLEPALAPGERRRARWRIAGLRALRIGVPLLLGLALIGVAAAMAWSLLSESPTTSRRSTAATVSSAAAPASASPPAAPSKPQPATSRTQPPTASIGADNLPTPNHAGALDESGPEQLLADLNAIAGVGEARWVAQDTLELSLSSASGDDSGMQSAVCAAMADHPGAATTTISTVSASANHGFELLRRTLTCP